MKLSKSIKQNFKSLETAFKNGDVALMDCQEKATGKSVALICAINWTYPHESREPVAEFVPFAVMIAGNPFEMYNPPSEEGEGYEQCSDSPAV